MNEAEAARELARIRAKRSGFGLTILGIDPGTTATGVAFLEDGLPTGLQVLRSSGTSVTKRVADMARQVGEVVRMSRHRATVVAVEWQAIRPDDKRPNDILHLAMIVGAALANVHPDQKLLTPLPVSWKGSISGDAFSARIQNWFLATKDIELEVPGAPPHLWHNAFDALGLAAWAINQRIPWSI